MNRVTIMAKERVQASLWRRAMAYACDFMAAYPNRPAGKNIALKEEFAFKKGGSGRGEFMAWYTPSREVYVRIIIHAPGKTDDG